MTTSCDDFDLPAGERDDDRWRRHLRECPRCGEEAGAERRLAGALGSPPELRFSPTFDSTLRRRLGERSRPRGVGTGGWAVLAAYGTTTAALTVGILSRIEWPTFSGLGIVFGLAVLMTPLLALPRISPLAPPA